MEIHKIGVIIPMYNAATTIVNALESVKKQTCKEAFQILVINDGSTDNSQQVVEEYINSNPDMDIKLFNQSNKGVSSARNIGLNNVDTEFVAFLDADDEWLPEKTEKQMKLFEEFPALVLVGCNRNGEVYKRFLFSKIGKIKEIHFKTLLLKNFFPTSGVVIRKNIVGMIGYFNENQQYMEDVDYWIRICRLEKGILLNESLVHYGRGKPYFGYSGLSLNLWKMEKAELTNIKRYLQSGDINIIEFACIYVCSLLKYLRRILIVKIR